MIFRFSIFCIFVGMSDCRWPTTYVWFVFPVEWCKIRGLCVRVCVRVRVNNIKRVRESCKKSRGEKNRRQKSVSRRERMSDAFFSDYKSMNIFGHHQWLVNYVPRVLESIFWSYIRILSQFSFRITFQLAIYYLLAK